MKIALLALALAVASGCGGDDGTAFEGIYSIDTWTENPDDCNSDGDSILADQTDTAFYLENANFLGSDFVTGTTCADVDACAMDAAESDFVLLGFNFNEGNDTDGWESGAGAFLSNDGQGGPCTGAVFLQFMSSPADGVIRIETQNKEIVDLPAGSDGSCDTDVAIEMEPDLPCTSLEVIEGTFAQDL